MLTNEFIALCDEFVKSKNNILNKDIEDTKKICKYRIEFFGYILEFRYVKKENLYFKPNSLYCVLSLQKNSVVHYHLTDIIPFLSDKCFKSCYFWNIPTAAILRNCFCSLVSTIETVISQIQPFLMNNSILQKSLFDNYITLYNLKPHNIDFEKIEDPNDYSQTFFLSLQDMRDGYIFSRFSNFAPYALLVKNKVYKALKKYEKLYQKNKLFEYEKQLVNHISNSENKEFCLFDKDCYTQNADKLLSFSSIAKAFLTVFIVFSFLFCGSIGIYNYILSYDTLILLSAPWYVGFPCAALCSIFGALALFHYMPNKRISKEEKKHLSNLVVQKGTKRLAFIAFAVSVLFSLFFAISMMVSNVRFYDDSIDFMSQEYNYSQIHNVYYIKARHNPKGDIIQRPSYVILFKDKTSLDLDGYTSVKYTEEVVLPLLKDKGLDIIRVDSDNELPWY